MSSPPDPHSARVEQLLQEYSRLAHAEASGGDLWTSSESSPPEDPPSPEDLPDYGTAIRRPTQPTTYKLIPLPYSAMIVTQHAEDTEAGAAYHIITDMDRFMPLNYITTIRRGSSCLGRIVGEFEMSITEDWTVRVKGHESPLDAVLSKLSGTRTSAMWFWNGFPDRGKGGLLWDTRKVPFLCVSLRDIADGKGAIASFTPAQRGANSHPGAPAELTVTALGQRYFNRVILSLLIIERKRLVPKSSVLKRWFD